MLFMLVFDVYSATVRTYERSVVMSMFVCLHVWRVCLCVRERICEATCVVFTKFLCVLPMTVAPPPPVRNVMYFRFYGWRHVYTYTPCSKKGDTKLVAVTLLILNEFSFLLSDCTVDCRSHRTSYASQVTVVTYLRCGGIFNNQINTRL